jgi:Flp pilus assembly protein TadD
VEQAGVQKGAQDVRKVVAALVLSASLGMASEDLKEQMRFGIEAAKRNLWSEARFRWKKVIDADPTSGAAFNNLGVALEREGRVEEAVEMYRRAAKLMPANTYVKRNLDRCEEILKGLRGTQEGAKK